LRKIICSDAVIW